MDEKKTITLSQSRCARGSKAPKRTSRSKRTCFPLFGEEESFFVYLSFGSEVSTKGLIRALLARGKKVCVPRIEGGVMRSVPYREPLEAGAYGILQPQGGEETTCRVALTPLLAVDGEGYRLGYGGGYYDKYFALHPDVLRVGLAYAGQAVEGLPREQTDMPLHAVVTEKGVMRFL